MPVMMRTFIFFLLTGFLVADVPAQVLPDTVRAHIEARIDAGYNVGIVVGVIDSAGTHVEGFGRTALKDSTTPGAQTLFEIGSVTKVFTALLLADQVTQGTMALGDPVAAYLPDSLEIPPTVTLEDLATHTSGLPRMPTNFAPADVGDPYADYTEALLFESLKTFDGSVGDKTYAYSNLGYGLLGTILVRAADTTYAALIQERIARPLGLDDTVVALSNEQQERLAQGHSDGAPVPNWTLTTMAGAGALRSTAEDMLRFVAANAGLLTTPLDAAMALMQAPREPTGTGMQVGLGWHIRPTPTGPVLWHNGGTGGYHSFVGFDPAVQRGVVVLTNSTTSIDDLGFHLLDASFPLDPVKTAIDLPSATLDRYVGQYQIAPTFIIGITREEDQLVAQVAGQQPFNIYPSSETSFFLKAADAEITFSLDEEGVVEGLILHQGGRELPGEKLE
jgi:CubicO group peptidase (beta-lactamase class C family)